MQFYSRKWVKPEDLNPNGTLFGGRLLAWIDEEAAIYAMCQLKDKRVVTKFMSEINFVAAACHSDVIELGLETVGFGRTSMTMKCEARNKDTKSTILTIEKLVFVVIGDDGKPRAHGITGETGASE
jgi:acyl-CoA thioesterase YciA